MDRYAVPRPSQPSKPKPDLRPRWKRIIAELNGRFPPTYRHEMSRLLLDSYSEIGAFAHLYHINGERCQTHMNRIDGMNMNVHPVLQRVGITGLDFDAKGIYLASVTKTGCLTVHDFESLYCLSNGIFPCFDDKKHLLHLSAHKRLDVVRWNLANQDEVACTSMQSNEILIFDIAYVSSEPIEVLKRRSSVTVHGCNTHKGLSDVVFTSSDKSRLLASDTYGLINIWDRRMSYLPCLELTTNAHSALNSVQLNGENQIVFGAGKHGIIYVWDLRGGRTSAAFQSHKEVYHPPITSMKLALALQKIKSLKAQSEILPREVHSINLNPSCPYQLAFHLDDGWSGVLDTNSLEVTHIHCPPPSWLDVSNISSSFSYLRKPSWVPTYSIYAVPSSSGNGVHLLDFYPNARSACHVDFSDDIMTICEETNRKAQNRFIPLSEGVVVCATHPLNGTILAGTKQSSLLVISQRHHSCPGADCSQCIEENCSKQQLF